MWFCIFSDVLKCVVFSGVASAISEGDIFIYSCSAQLISFEIESTSKEIIVILFYFTRFAAPNKY